MGNQLPTLLAIFLSALAIIAVLLWRIKPQTGGDSEALRRQLAEEANKVRTLADRLTAQETQVTTALTETASHKATAQALTQQKVDVEERLKQAHNTISILQTEVNGLTPQIAKLDAERRGAEDARERTQQRLDDQSKKYDSLRTDHNMAVERAAAAETASSNLKSRMAEMGLAIEGMQQELSRTRKELNEANTKHQVTEDAVRQFENISQKVLRDILTEAKQNIGELAGSLQKFSGQELEKHAAKVAESLEPLAAKLKDYDEAVQSLKTNSSEIYGGLKAQLVELQNTERTLHEQARALTTALSASPKVKGTYGEMILTQLVEFVGMQQRCHFEPQASRETEEGRKIPDMVISLPAGQKVLIDSKAVMSACVEAHRTQDEQERVVWLRKHCENVKSRVIELSAKNYFKDHAGAVEAVVLFLPAENLYAAAVENDPELTEFAMRRNIIVCGPNSLLMLLKVATQLWQRASIEEEAQRIAKQGNDIYKYTSDFLVKFAQLGSRIRQLATEYNDATGTLEGRLLPAGRRLGNYEAITKNAEILDLNPVKEAVRDLKSPEAKKMLARASQKTMALPGSENEEQLFVLSDTDAQDQ